VITISFSSEEDALGSRQDEYALTAADEPTKQPTITTSETCSTIHATTLPFLIRKEKYHAMN